MSFSYGLGSNPSIDVPRLLIADTSDSGHIFEDEEIQMMANVVSPAFAITASGGGAYQSHGTPSYRFVAAGLLDALASSRARLSSALKVLDITIDPAKASVELRTQAECLREAERQDGSFAIAEATHDQFAARERIWKQMLRLQT